MAAFSRHFTPSIEQKALRQEFAPSASTSHAVSSELAFWQQRKQSVQNTLSIMLGQQMKEESQLFSRRSALIPTSLEMIILSRQGELKTISEHINKLQTEESRHPLD